MTVTEDNESNYSNGTPTSLHKLNIDSHSAGWVPLDTYLQRPTKLREEITNAKLSKHRSYDNQYDVLYPLNNARPSSTI